MEGKAYKLSGSGKMGKEDVSRLDRNRFSPAHTADNLLRNLHKIDISESTLDRTEEVILARRESMAGYAGPERRRRGLPARARRR